MNKIKFIQGEDKHVKLLVRSPDNEPFTILSASYTLSRYGEAEAQGECHIDDHYLDIKIAPTKKAAYAGIGSHALTSTGCPGVDRIMCEIYGII